MGEAGILNGDASDRELACELELQRLRDLLDVGAQRDRGRRVIIILQVVVGVDARHVAQRGLYLHGHVAFVVVHVEDGLGGVGDAPHDDGRYLYGVAHLVVDLDALTFMCAGAQRDLGHMRASACGRQPRERRLRQ